MAAKARKKGTSKRGSGKKKTLASKRSSRRRASKMEPAVRCLKYEFVHTTGGAAQSHFVDLAKDLSLVNRRLYQQGREYFIKKITVTNRDNNGYLQVSTAPSGWPVHQGWKMAKKLYDQMREGHGGAPGSGLPTSMTPAKWSDFKVYLSEAHRTSATTPRPVDNAGNLVSVANSEWNHATFVSPDAGTGSDLFFVHLLGDHVGAAGARTSVGIVQAYEESRRTVQQDDTGDEIDTDSPWINLFDDGTTLDEIANQLKIEGDLPPYDIEAYPGGAANMPAPLVQGLVAIVPYSTPGSSPSVVLGGFSAPCGLLELQTLADSDSNTMSVIIELAQGDYKGIKAPSME